MWSSQTRMSVPPKPVFIALVGILSGTELFSSNGLVIASAWSAEFIPQ